MWRYGLGGVEMSIGRTEYTSWENRTYGLGDVDIRFGRSGYTVYEIWIYG